LGNKEQKNFRKRSRDDNDGDFFDPNEMLAQANSREQTPVVQEKDPHELLFGYNEGQDPASQISPLKATKWQ
jgi:hypothetical protein